MSLISEIEEVAAKGEKAIKADVEKMAGSAVTQAASPIVTAVEKSAEGGVTKIFDQSIVDIRNELPGLMAKLGVNTSDEGSVLHGTLALVVSLLEAYGPAEIRSVLQGSASA